MKTFVLVHVAGVGEWCFDPLIPWLEAEGHTALVVSLTGFGQKRHLHSPDITILDHVRDVVEFVESCDLQGISLVGHSYGGGMITGAWDQLRDRVRELVFIDAATPADGESHFDHMRRYGGSGQIEAIFGRVMAARENMRSFPIKAL